MKFILRTILKYYLKYITKLVLFIHRPKIIAIAGSTNKTFVKNEINKVLRKQGLLIRSNPKPFNTEIGLPLAILGLPSGYHEYKKWLPILLEAPLRIFHVKFPKILVLEIGVANPGDMKYLLSIIKPTVGIITDITQRYVDQFAGIDEMVGEYKYLIKAVKPEGLLVLNYDNYLIRDLSRSTEVKSKNIEFFGFKDGTKWQVMSSRKTKIGQKIKIAHNDIIDEYSISMFGQHHAYALLVSLIIKRYVTKEKEKN